MVHLWAAVDLSRAFAVWEADDPMKLATTMAIFLPFGEIEVTPIGAGDQVIAAMVAGGLMQFPG